MNRELNRSFLLCLIFLLGLGIVQVYSSSFIFAIESFNDGLFFVKKQIVFAIVALVVLLVTALAPLQWIERVGLGVWILSFLGIVMTLIPGFGVRVGGAARWLNIGGGFRIEPSEILKYTYPIFLAVISERIYLKKDAPFARIVMVLIAVAPLVFLLRQPDFGAVAIISSMVFAIFFARGLSWKYVVAGLGVLSISFYFLIAKVDYRMARVRAFLDPWSDPEQKGFQVIQSMLGYHSGGLTGVGLGQGQGKLFFLPEAHTDFTLSVLGEELGFLGISVVIFLYSFIVFQGLRIAAQCRHSRWHSVALGITILFGITSIVNFGVTLGMLPTKGLGLPFLSYGGSALIATCFGMGVLLNIERHNRKDKYKSFIKI